MDGCTLSDIPPADVCLSTAPASLEPVTAASNFSVTPALPEKS